EENNLYHIDIIDLNEYNFPVFNERLRFQNNPAEKVVEFTGRIKSADGIIMVTPEYNGGYPASLKNVIDLLYDEWHRKPIAIATVSNGQFGGSQVITSLLFSLWKMRAWVIPAMFPVPYVQNAFDIEGNPADVEAVSKRTENFINELFWCIEAKSRMSI
ncbi:MAG: NAD(P)H-dependent oxidoreductase, partial [Bacteroidota bacterium]|nr:NAD(P)H-dependent oxidoreductase [Bacteroidota bacterium]